MLRPFAEAGYHGTTTRRIGQEADLNEVTVFRHFGSPGLCEDTNEEFFQLVRFLVALQERGEARPDFRGPGSRSGARRSSAACGT